MTPALLGLIHHVAIENSMLALVLRRDDSRSALFAPARQDQAFSVMGKHQHAKLIIL
jgi:hypothetical protein